MPKVGREFDERQPKTGFKQVFFAFTKTEWKI